MSKNKTPDNTNEPDIEDFAAEVVATATDADVNTDDVGDDADDSNATTFPLTRTFVHCDSTGRELSYVSVTATITLTRINGVTLTLDEIERRFRRNFYLSFKGGKASVQPVSASGDSNSNARPRRTMSAEHKQKLQEARQRRANGAARESQDTDVETVKLGAALLTGLSDTEWRGKSACLRMTDQNVDAATWSLAIRYLLDTDQIEARGEKRGREYRRIKATKGAGK